MFMFLFRDRRHSDAPPAAPRITRLIHRIDYHRRATVSTATLTWTPPTTRTDGTVLPPDQIAGADIFDSASSTPAVAIGSVDGAAKSFSTGVLAVGVHNFTVVTRDTTGHSSAASNMATITVPATLANPAAVTDLAATLVP